jgi:F-box protein, helicase, 18
LTDLSPTDEQRAILEARGRIVKINARAGTGKTTTLRMLAEKFSDHRILYLVCNRRARESARDAFPANVRAYTLHALAYRDEGHKWTVSSGFGPVDLLPAFKQDRQVLASLSFEFLTFFLNSAHERLEHAAGPFAGILTGERLGNFKDHQGAIVAAARELAGAWYHRKRDCPHDFYLKMFHMTGGFARELNQCDMVLVDEGQDLSPIMLDALSRCRSRIVVVGDTHQQIYYGFRYAVDAMERMAADETFDLSLSFRFGKPIAGLATALIRQAKGEKDFTILGNPDRRSAVRFFEHPGKVPADAAFLSRTNLALFGNAIQLRAKGTPFQFERDLQPTLYRTLDVFWLQSGKRDAVRDAFIGSFDGYEALKRYADKMEDFTLTGMCQIVEKHGDQFPSVIFEMAERCRKNPNGDADGDREGITLSTVHSAKGQQYREVYVHQDIADSLQRAWSGEGSAEDINVAYVAVTRPTQRIHLFEGFKKILTPAWQQMMERLDVRGARVRPDINRGNPTRSPIESRGSLRSTSRRRAEPAREPITKQPVEATVEIGARVKTPLGPGTVVEIRGKECLVSLDKGPVRVWRPIRSVL